MSSRTLVFSLLVSALAVNAFAAETVGLSKGDFRVDESGSATYGLPFNLPQGRAGVTPGVGLSYSSNNLSEGPVGVGWSITGLSGISRCPQSPAYDDNIKEVTFDDSDNFCLDGQRLIIRSGTYGAPNSTYRIDKNPDTLVTAKGGSLSNGPQYFEVENKAGERHFYGNITPSGSSPYTPDNAFVIPGGFTNNKLAKSWLIKVIKDVKDNYIEFNYQSDSNSGSAYISRIRYTGNSATGDAPFAEVSFSYDNYTKGFQGFSAGSHTYHNKLLKQIDVSIDDDDYRSYFLTYQGSDFIEERTMLTSVQECSDSDKSLCYPATRFEWNHPPLSGGGSRTECEVLSSYERECYKVPYTTPFRAYDSNRTVITGTDNRYTSKFLDMNGDGYSDLVYYSNGYVRVNCC